MPETVESRLAAAQADLRRALEDASRALREVGDVRERTAISETDIERLQQDHAELKRALGKAHKRADDVGLAAKELLDAERRQRREEIAHAIEDVTKAIEHVAEALEEEQEERERERASRREFREKAVQMGWALVLVVLSFALATYVA